MQYLDIKTKYRSGEIAVVDLLNQCFSFLSSFLAFTLNSGYYGV